MYHSHLSVKSKFQQRTNESAEDNKKYYMVNREKKLQNDKDITILWEVPLLFHAKRLHYFQSLPSLTTPKLKKNYITAKYLRASILFQQCITLSTILRNLLRGRSKSFHWNAEFHCFNSWLVSSVTACTSCLHKENLWDLCIFLFFFF